MYISCTLEKTRGYSLEVPAKKSGLTPTLASFATLIETNLQKSLLNSFSRIKNIFKQS